MSQWFRARTHTPNSVEKRRQIIWKVTLPCDLGNYFACFLGKYFACSAKQGFELDELVCFSEVSQIHFPQGLLK